MLRYLGRFSEITIHTVWAAAWGAFVVVWLLKTRDSNVQLGLGSATVGHRLFFSCRSSFYSLGGMIRWLKYYSHMQAICSDMCRYHNCGLRFCFFKDFRIYLSHLDIQHKTWTHDLEIKSCMLHGLSQLGAPEMFVWKSVRWHGMHLHPPLPLRRGSVVNGLLCRLREPGTPS